MPAKWSRLHEAQRERIIELLERDDQPFKDVSDEAKAARRALPLVDPTAPTDWCRTYLPHYFDAPFAPFHRRMVEASGDAAMPTFVAAFRGAGKSVLLSFAQPLHSILGREMPYAIYGAQVQLLAAQLMDNLRIELDHNARIRTDYGELSTDGSENDWVVDLGRERSKRGTWAIHEIKLEAFGIGQSPRGKRFRQHRPCKFIGDDLEGAELARNPRREQQLWDWLYDEVLPGLIPDTYTFTIVGTMYGPGCMMERAREMAAKADPAGRPLAKLMLQKATDEAGHSVWPGRFSDAALARIRAQIGIRNWLRNYDLTAEDPDKPFQAAWLLEYDTSDLADLAGKLDVVAFLDPALSEAPTGCPRALVVVGADRKSGRRYVLDAWIDRGSPVEMCNRIVQCNDRWHPRIVGIESNGGYALIKPLLEERTRGKAWIPVRYVPHVEAKELRIERLAPQTEAGRWLFPRNPPQGVRTLQEQLLSYPDGFIDGPDAMAGCDEQLPDTWQPAAGRVEHKTLERRRDLAGVV